MRLLNVLNLIIVCLVPATLSAALEVEVPDAAVPEPGTALLLVPALAAFVVSRRLRSRGIK
jgi:hypothetical protein